MEWSKNLFVGPLAKKKQYKLMRRINQKKLSKAYVLTFPSNPENILDIYSYLQLKQKYYDDKDIYIIGLACGKMEAYELAKDIIWEVYKSTGNFRVKDYFKKEAGR